MCAITAKASGRLSRCSWVLLFSLLSGCGGGGDGGGSAKPNPQPESNPIVGGIVSAPNAAAAFPGKQQASSRIARLSTVSVQPALNGATPVPDGTRIELARVDESGNVIEVIASTRTFGGRYRFDFEKLGLEFSSDLIVRAVNQDASEQLRASVIHGVSDIDPITEATFRLFFDIEEVRREYFVFTGAFSYADRLSFNDISTDDLTEIAAAVRLFATITNFSVLSDIESTVDGFLLRLSYQEALAEFIGSILDAYPYPGIGPGDIGNYYPMKPGITWTYEASATNVEGSEYRYETQVKTLGHGSAESASSFEITSSIRPGSHERYLRKIGVDRGGADTVLESITSELDGYAYDYPIAYFPPVVGKKRFRGDIDEDGTTDYDSQPQLAFWQDSYVMVLGFETVTVPIGTFKHVLKVKTEAIVPSDRATSQGQIPRTTTVEWFAPGVGLIKKISEHPSGDSAGGMETTLEELTALSGLELPIIDGLTVVPIRARDMVYNEATDRIYASVPIEQGDSATSSDSNSGGIYNTLTVINPNNAKIEESVFVGTEPGPLALSRDGQTLYVGLRGAPKVAIVDIPSMQVTNEIELGLHPDRNKPTYDGAILAADDIDVSPDDSSIIAVSMTSLDWINDYDSRPMGVAIFDNGVKRPETTEMYPYRDRPDKIEFAESGNILYGSDSDGEAHLFTWSVDENGLRQLDADTSLLSYYHYGLDIEFSNGHILASTGELINPVSKRLVGTFDVGTDEHDNFAPFIGVAPDVAASRVYFLRDHTIKVFDLNTFTLVGQADFPREYDYSWNWDPSSLIRVGGDRLAVAIGPKIYLLDKAVLR